MKRVVAFALAAVIGMIALTSCGVIDNFVDGFKPSDTTEQGAHISVTPGEDASFSSLIETEVANESMNMGLSVVRLSAPSDNVKTVSVEGEDGIATIEELTPKVSYRLTATVLPEEAPEGLKLVDWSAYWVTNNTGSSKDLSQFVSVTPDADGSSSATVDFYRSFVKSVIGIKVTTRMGGHSSTCRFTYKGVPSQMKLLDNSTNKEYVSTPENLLTVESTPLYIRPVLSGVLGVGNEYYNNISVNITASGEFGATYMMEPAYNDYEMTIDASEFDWDSFGLFTVEKVDSSSGDVYVVTVNYDAFDQYYVIESSQNENADKILYEYYGMENVIFTVTLTQTETNVTKSLQFKISGVTGVNLSETDVNV